MKNPSSPPDSNAVPLGIMVGNIVAAVTTKTAPEYAEYAAQVQKLFAGVTNNDTEPILEVTEWLEEAPDRVMTFITMIAGTQIAVIDTVGKMTGESSHALVEKMLVRILDPDRP